jgi:hypothetical protein
VDTQALVAVVAGIALVAILGNEWRRARGGDPDKRERWRRLPFRFKLACWFVVIPLFCLAAAAPFLKPNWVGGFMTLTATAVAWLAMAIAEGRAVAWYRAHGLLPETEDEDAI